MQAQSEVIAGIAVLKRNIGLVVLVTLATVGLGVTTAAVAEPSFESEAVIEVGQVTNWFESHVRPQPVVPIGDLIDSLRSRFGLDRGDPTSRPMPRIESVAAAEAGERHLRLVSLARSPDQAQAHLTEVLKGLLTEHHNRTVKLVEGLIESEGALKRQIAEMASAESRHLKVAADPAVEANVRSQHILLASQIGTQRRNTEGRLTKVRLLNSPIYNQPTQALVAPTTGREVGRSSLPMRGVLSLVLGFFFGILLALLRDLSRGQL